MSRSGTLGNTSSTSMTWRYLNMTMVITVGELQCDLEAHNRLEIRDCMVFLVHQQRASSLSLHAFTHPQDCQRPQEGWFQGASPRVSSPKVHLVKLPGGKTTTMPLHRKHIKQARCVEVSPKTIAKVKEEIVGRLEVFASGLNLWLSCWKTLYRTNLSLHDYSICKNEREPR